MAKLKVFNFFEVGKKYKQIFKLQHEPDRIINNKFL